MKLAQVLAEIRVSPRHLYWRWRLLTWEKPRGVSRALLLESLLRLTRAMPQFATPPQEIRRWSLKEAREWVRLLRGANAAETHLIRAKALSSLTTTRADAASVIREARREFDQLPLRAKKAHPVLWGRILLADEPREFEARLHDIFDGLRQTPRADVGMTTVSWWLKDRRMPAVSRDRIRKFIDELPDNLVNPSVRIDLAENDGLEAIVAGDLVRAEAAFTSMTRWAPFDNFPGNRMKLVDAALAKGILREQCRAFLAVVLKREWRDWVRPKIETRAALAAS